MNHRCWQPFFNLTMACTRSGLWLDRSILSSGSAAKLKRYVAFVGTGGGGAGLVDLMGVVGGLSTKRQTKKQTWENWWDLEKSLAPLSNHLFHLASAPASSHLVWRIEREVGANQP